ncbi:hypothetical protein GJAV_G00057920 [Gymnothorax javanicus]|nr:hypothetical protein GJAV_G00057920 [Gymnothorax javanicus]
MKLTKNIRAKPDEKTFSEWLLKLGDGKVKSRSEDAEDGMIDVPQDCIVIGSLIDAVFPDINDQDISGKIILTPKNEDSLKLKDEILERVDGEKKTYYSVDNVVTDNEEEAHSYSQEFLHSLTPTGMPPHQLNLKVGAIVMLLRNLDIRNGLCNGTRLTIKNLYANILDAEILTGSNKGKRVLIPRVKLAPSDPNLPFVLERRQFPLPLRNAVGLSLFSLRVHTLAAVQKCCNISACTSLGHD